MAAERKEDRGRATSVAQKRAAGSRVADEEMRRASHDEKQEHALKDFVAVLEQDVSRLEESHQAERGSRLALEDAMAVAGVTMPDLETQEENYEIKKLEAEVEWLQDELSALRLHLNLLQHKAAEQQRQRDGSPTSLRARRTEALLALQGQLQEELEWIGEMHRKERINNDKLESLLEQGDVDVTTFYETIYDDLPSRQDKDVEELTNILEHQSEGRGEEGSLETHSAEEDPTAAAAAATAAASAAAAAAATAGGRRRSYDEREREREKEREREQDKDKVAEEDTGKVEGPASAGEDVWDSHLQRQQRSSRSRAEREAVLYRKPTLLAEELIRCMRSIYRKVALSNASGTAERSEPSLSASATSSASSAAFPPQAPPRGFAAGAAPAIKPQDAQRPWVKFSPLSSPSSSPRTQTVTTQQHAAKGAGPPLPAGGRTPPMASPPLSRSESFDLQQDVQSLSSMTHSRESSGDWSVLEQDGGAAEVKAQETSARDPYGVLSEHPCPDAGDYVNMIEVMTPPLEAKLSQDPTASLARFRSLAEQLTKVNPGRLTDDEKLAFWINLYNALVMHAYISPSTGAKPQLKRANTLSKAAFIIGGHQFSALAIEYSVLRASSHRPSLVKMLPVHRFKNDDERYPMTCQQPEPLVSFALCNGSRSSPVLRVYKAKNVREELEIAKEDYFRAAIGINRKDQILLPKILDWYGRDFAANALGLVEWVAKQLPYQQMQAVQARIPKKKAALSKSMAIIPYDWTFRYLIEP
eukprot:SM000006S19347  [mRNA]  locus=s6:251520:257165:+ [translate_table: standard]